MAIQKDALSIKWYLDDRKIRSEPDSAFSKAPLKITLYHRKTGARKHIHANEFFTRGEWDSISQINTSAPPNDATKKQIQRKANLDATISRVRSFNSPDIQSLSQFMQLLTGPVLSNSLGPAYLFQIFDAFTQTKNNPSTRVWYESARKKFYEFTMVHIKGKDPSKFLVADLNKRYIDSFKYWYQDQDKNNSRDAAYSYLRGLRGALNWAMRPKTNNKPKYIKRSQNIFYTDKIVIPEAKRRAEKLTLSEFEFKLFLSVEALSKEEERAKDLQLFMFLFDGIRIGDVMRLERSEIEVRDGITYLNFNPKKTDQYNKDARVEITPQLQHIMDRWPGDDKYVFDILSQDMNEETISRKIKSKTSTINRNLKKLSDRCGLERRISTYSARYSMNHYLLSKGYATKGQLSAMMVNSPKVSEGYFSAREEKFGIQRKLGNILEPEDDEKIKKQKRCEMTSPLT